MKVLLDLDCVLCDFIGPTCALWDLSVREVRAHWTPGKNDMIPALGAALRVGIALQERIYHALDAPFSQAELHVRIEREGEDWWANLPPLPWMKELVELVSQYTSNWWVVTNPCEWVAAYSGKARWCKKHFGSSFDRFHITPHKAEFARPRAVLVDDREATVLEFVEAGGIGMVFPAYHNSLHTLAENPLEIIRSNLAGLASAFEMINQIQGDADITYSRLYPSRQDGV